MTENPVTWFRWLWHTHHNGRKRWRAVRHWWTEWKEDYETWSHARGERMHQNRLQRRDRRERFSHHWHGHVECVDCVTGEDGTTTSTWLRPSDVLDHLERQHSAVTLEHENNNGNGSDSDNGNDNGTTSHRRRRRRRERFPAAELVICLACGAMFDPSAGHLCPAINNTPRDRRAERKNRRDMQRSNTWSVCRHCGSVMREREREEHEKECDFAHASHSQDERKEPNKDGTTKSNATKSTDTTNTASKNGNGNGNNKARMNTDRRSNVAGADGLVEAMMNWAQTPPETYEQECAEAEQMAEAFRGISDAFRQRGEMLVEYLRIDPSCVEPYNDAATAVNGVGEHAMEVSRLIGERYMQHREDVERGHFSEETVRFFGDGGGGTGAGTAA